MESQGPDASYMDMEDALGYGTLKVESRIFLGTEGSV